jgi:hypothetical protein
MRLRVAPSIVAIAPWKAASAGVGRPAVGDPAPPGEIQEGEPGGTVVMDAAGFGLTTGRDEQAPPTNDATRQTATVRTQDRLRLTGVSVDGPGNAVVSLT